MQRDRDELLRGSDWMRTWDLNDGDWVWQADDQVRGEVRAGGPSGAVLHTWIRGQSDVITSVAGELTLIIPYTVNETWTDTTVVLDVEITRPGNALGLRRYRPIAMTLTVDHDVTRS